MYNYINKFITCIPIPQPQKYDDKFVGAWRVIQKIHLKNILFEINHGVGMASIKEEIESSLFSLDLNYAEEEDSVYVAVEKSESSMDAFSWTLAHFVNTSTTLYLIHVFPEIRYIPSPCKQTN